MISTPPIKSVLAPTVALVGLALLAWRDSWPAALVVLVALLAAETRGFLTQRKADQLADLARSLEDLREQLVRARVMEHETELVALRDQLARAKNRGGV